jgi:hypothetical protein
MMAATLKQNSSFKSEHSVILETDLKMWHLSAGVGFYRVCD